MFTELYRAVYVLRLVSTTDSRTERLHMLLLPVSIRPSCIAHMYLFQFSLLLASFPTQKYSIAPVFLVVYSCCNNSFYSTMCTCHDHKLRVICVDLCACPHTIKSCLSRVYPCDIMYNVPAPPLLVGRAWELVEACCIVDSGSGQWNSVYL